MYLYEIWYIKTGHTSDNTINTGLKRIVAKNAEDAIRGFNQSTWKNVSDYITEVKLASINTVDLVSSSCNTV